MNPRLLGYEPSVLPTELTPQRGGFNHVTTSARSKRLMIAQYSVASVDTTKAANALDLWCPSSKTALFKFSLRQLGHRLTRPLSQVIHSPTHVVTRPSLHEELPRRSLFAQFRSKRYECIASTVELRHPSDLALHYAVASNLAGTQQNRTVVRPSAPY